MLEKWFLKAIARLTAHKNDTSAWTPTVMSPEPWTDKVHAPRPTLARRVGDRIVFARAKNKGPVGYANDRGTARFTGDSISGDVADHSAMNVHRMQLGRQGGLTEFMPNADENDRSAQMFGAKSRKSAGPVSYGPGDSSLNYGDVAPTGSSWRGGQGDKP